MSKRTQKREYVKVSTRKRKQVSEETKEPTIPKRTMQTLQNNLITNVDDVKLIHVASKGPVVFTIPSSDASDLYTLSVDFDMDDAHKVDINFRCSCGDKYSKFGRNNCKHIGKVISTIMEKYIRNTINKKELDIDIESLKL